MLRTYQESTISGVRKKLRSGRKRIIVQLATGGGKTVIFSYIAKKLWDKNIRTLIFTDRIELLKQAGSALDKFNLNPHLIHGQVRPETLKSAPLCIAMEQTLARRLGQEKYKAFLYSFDYIFIDEAHKTSFDKYFDFFNPKANVFGFTATPTRYGSQTGLDAYYDDIVIGPSINELISLGFLSPAITRVSPFDVKTLKVKGNEYDLAEMDKHFMQKVYSDGVIENYLKHTPGTKALVFCPGVKSSINLTEEFLNAGIRARHLDAETDKDEREHTLKVFGKDFDVLCNCGILTTGFDCPNIETIILYRATKSKVLYFQMIGRGSRTAPGKGFFNILDFGSNAFTHGRWEQPQEYSLKKEKKRRGKEKDMGVYRVCSGCDAFLEAHMMVCPYCGKAKELTEKERIEVDLKILSPLDFKERVQTMSFNELEMVAKIKNYHKNWVHRIIAQRGGYEELKAFEKSRSYKTGWATRAAFNYGIFH